MKSIRLKRFIQSFQSKFVVLDASYTPIISHNFISFNNISNILRCLYGITHLMTGTTL